MPATNPPTPTYTHFHGSYAMTCNAHLEVIAFNADPDMKGHGELVYQLQIVIAGMIDNDASAPGTIWRLTIEQDQPIHWFFGQATEIVIARRIASKHQLVVLNDDWLIGLPRGEILTSALEFEDISLGVYR